MTTRFLISTTLALGVAALGGCKAADETTAAAANDTVATAGTTPATTASASDFAAGQWSMTAEITDVQATGASPEDETGLAQLRDAMTGKPSTQEVCISQADVDGGLEKLFVTPGAECTTDSKQIAGGQMTAVYTCKAQNGTTANIKTTGAYTAATLNTATQIQTPGPRAGTGMTMSAKTTGKRVGDC